MHHTICLFYEINLIIFSIFSGGKIAVFEYEWVADVVDNPHFIPSQGAIEKSRIFSRRASRGVARLLQVTTPRLRGWVLAVYVAGCKIYTSPGRR